MKKISKIILILLMVCLPIKAWALEGEVKINCPQTVEPGQTVTCQIMGFADKYIATFEANLNVSNGAEILGVEIERGNLQGGYDNGAFSLYGGEIEGNITIADVSLRISHMATEEITLELSNIKMSLLETPNGTQYEEVISGDSVSRTMGLVSHSCANGLRSLSVEGYELQPAFSSSSYGYAVTIDSDTFKVIAEPNNPDDEVVIYNYENQDDLLDANHITYVPNGEAMMLIIEVGSGTNAAIYNITVTRDSATTGYDNTLGSLTVGGKNVNLSTGQYDSEYDATIFYVQLKNIETYQIEATPADPDNFELDPENGGTGTWHNASDIIIIVRPIRNTAYQSKKYIVKVSKEGSGGPSSGTIQEGPVGGNPGTGNISIFIITSILIASLIISLYVYRKNMANFN